VPQLPTTATTIESVMRSAAFKRGVADVRLNRPPSFDSDHQSEDSEWDYERGRLWAIIAPRTMPITQSGRLHKPAVALFRKAIDGREIL
jgi:hypothetical protein